VICVLNLLDERFRDVDLRQRLVPFGFLQAAIGFFDAPKSSSEERGS